MSNETVTYTTKRGEIVTIDADTVVNARTLWNPAYHCADVLMPKLGLDPKKHLKIRNKLTGNFKASMSALYDGSVTAGDVDYLKKVDEVPSDLLALVQWDRFDYALKADGINIDDYPIFIKAGQSKSRTEVSDEDKAAAAKAAKAKVKREAAKAKREAAKAAKAKRTAAANILKPNGFGNNTVRISSTDPIDASEKKAKFDAFVDIAAELGIDIAALTKS